MSDRPASGTAIATGLASSILFRADFGAIGVVGQKAQGLRPCAESALSRALNPLQWPSAAEATLPLAETEETWRGKAPLVRSTSTRRTRRSLAREQSTSSSERTPRAKRTQATGNGRFRSPWASEPYREAEESGRSRSPQGSGSHQEASLRMANTGKGLGNANPRRQQQQQQQGRSSPSPWGLGRPQQQQPQQPRPGRGASESYPSVRIRLARNFPRAFRVPT